MQLRSALGSLLRLEIMEGSLPRLMLPFGPNRPPAQMKSCDLSFTQAAGSLQERILAALSHQRMGLTGKTWQALRVCRQAPSAKARKFWRPVARPCGFQVTVLTGALPIRFLLTASMAWLTFVARTLRRAMEV